MSIKESFLTPMFFRRLMVQVLANRVRILLNQAFVFNNAAHDLERRIRRLYPPNADEVPAELRQELEQAFCNKVAKLIEADRLAPQWFKLTTDANTPGFLKLTYVKPPHSVFHFPEERLNEFCLDIQRQFDGTENKKPR